MQREEIFNSVSHIVGGGLAAAGMVVLIVLAAMNHSAWCVVGVSIYGATLVLLYTFSSLYHGLEGRARQVFRRLDHLAIYLLIAGTYTAFTLGPLRGPWGWSLFGVLWGLAALGIAQEFIPQRTRRLSVILYVVMGWLVLIAIDPLMHDLSRSGLEWLAAGGLFYTVGVIFYLLDDKWRYGHEIWHLFVLAGSITQYGAVFLYVAYRPALGA